jgi:ClpX C4-type zinc finger
MATTAPPPALASARVLEYAIVDDSVVHTDRNPIFVAGQRLGPVPCLAIGRNLIGNEILLLHCDAGWDVLAVSGHPSIEYAKDQAEKNYAGLRARWQPVSYSDAELEAFLDEEDRGLICSFCGRHPHEVERIITGHRGAAICEICIKAMRERGDAETQS